MPEAVERKLREKAKRDFPGDKEKQDAYVYGTLRRKFGWKPDREKEERKK